MLLHLTIKYSSGISMIGRMVCQFINLFLAEIAKNVFLYENSIVSILRCRYPHFSGILTFQSTREVYYQIGTMQTHV